MRNIFLLIICLSGSSLYSQNANTDWGNIRRYAQENKTIISLKKEKPRVVFMGNSITEGWKSADGEFFHENSYINRGIGGQTTPQMLVRFRQDVINLMPDVVVILAGINDIAENTGPISLEEISGNIISMAQLAKANGIKVIISSVLPANRFPWRPEINPTEKVIQLNNLLQKYCNDTNTVYLDYYTKLVDKEKGLDAKYGEDGVHPNLTGYRVMEPLVQTAIKDALRKKG